MKDQKQAIVDFEIYSTGLCRMSVCSSLSIEETEIRANLESPTGIESRWHMSEDKTFADGITPNPCECNRCVDGTRKHYLLDC